MSEAAINNTANTTAPGALMTALRARTAALHVATENLKLMRKLMAPEVDLGTYRDYLAAIAAPYTRVEPHLHNLCAPATLARLGVQPKLPALERDLAALELEPSRLPKALNERLKDLVRDETDALGGLYVLEGATLGGRVISQQLTRNLGSAANTLPFGFLGSRVDPSPASGWRHFGTALEAEVSAGGHDPERVLSAAVAVFEIVHQGLGNSRCARDAREVNIG
ncbi:biliverdin-producing heme oxygenase [Thiorhodovibrio frisius]|uniref:Heme oxygenase n=1 Tax=Thiorhodovibrio frisius TaxID=631362 RepID=H8Z190_9GAMM|nr:biliverdin-producing heme oxygenase [Thiorhodovibrio frisius]EIC21405.1 heme oxygenase [Thiorhodovibrio frisius]WPL23991.1 Heme oxygenase [Thiorhodovibrio frisius]